MVLSRQEDIIKEEERREKVMKRFSWDVALLQ